MKNLRKLLALLLVLVCLCGTCSTALAYTTPAAAARTIASEAYSSGSKKVWIATDHGKKYHSRKTCWTLKNSKHLKHLKLSEAKKKGYKQPCKVCYK